MTIIKIAAALWGVNKTVLGAIVLGSGNHEPATSTKPGLAPMFS